jgi:hypothetical protein
VQSWESSAMKPFIPIMLTPEQREQLGRLRRGE